MSPTKYIQAYSRPVVNGQDLKILVGGGSSAFILEGNFSVLRGFAREILKGIDGDKAVVFDEAPVASSERKERVSYAGKPITADRQKYIAIRAEVEAPGFTGITQDVCARHEIAPSRYWSWVAYQRKREARKQPAA